MALQDKKNIIKIPAPKEFSFLQSLINRDLEQQFAGYEREENLNVLIEEKSYDFLDDKTRETLSDKNRQEINFTNSRGKSRKGDNIWSDLLTEEEQQEEYQVTERNTNELTKNISPELEKHTDKVDGSDDTVISNESVDNKTGLKKKRLLSKRKINKQRKCKNSPETTTTCGVDKKSYNDNTIDKSDIDDKIIDNSNINDNTIDNSNINDNTIDNSKIDDSLETMSEPSETNKPKLCRRKQMNRPRCAGPTPSKDVLQQKCQELHDLIVKPLTEPRQFIHHAQQTLLRLQGVSQQQVAKIMEIQSLRSEAETKLDDFLELPADSSDDVYSILRAAQINLAEPHKPLTAVHKPHKPLTAVHKPHRPLTAVQKPHRPLTAAQKPHRLLTAVHKRKSSMPGTDCQKRPFSADYHKDNQQQTKNKHHIPENTFNNFQVRTQHREKKNINIDEKKEETRMQEVDENEDKDKESSKDSSEYIASHPNPIAQHSNYNLKYSSNPALKDWLRKKKKELRLKKTQERKRLNEENAKKEESVRTREELFKDSDLKVREWIANKKKEARKIAKEKKKQLMEEKIKLERSKRQKFEAEKSKSLEVLLSKKSDDDKQFVPVTRPELEDRKIIQNTKDFQSDFPSTETKNPSSPTSKFIYRRPVSGQVRLMKQQKSKDNSNLSQNNLSEVKMTEDKSRKMRLSYDQWLLKKREENAAKQQEIAKQKMITKSDPELERIVPELARRRIEHIQRGKKRIDTGLSVINDEVNKSFGGSEFSSESQVHILYDPTGNKLGEEQVINKKLSTAKQTLSPKDSISPRRPMSAFSYSKVHKIETKQGSTQINSFKLPFPPKEGAPNHVLSKQKKLFSANFTENNALHNLNQFSEDSLKKSNDNHDVSTVIKDNKNVMFHDVSEDDDGLRLVDMRSNDDEKSFFITHGNVGDNVAGKYVGEAVDGESMRKSVEKVVEGNEIKNDSKKLQGDVRQHAALGYKQLDFLDD